MPRFVSNPAHVEAHQFHGSLTDLPPEFAGQLSQMMVGERAYLSSTVEGEFQDGQVAYAKADVVYPGDWIIKAVGTFSRMSNGEFAQAFVPVDEPEAVGTAARWQATYVGARDGSTPAVLHWLGYRFPMSVAVGVDDPEHAKIIRQNGHFTIRPSTVSEVIGMMTFEEMPSLAELVQRQASTPQAQPDDDAWDAQALADLHAISSHGPIEDAYDADSPAVGGESPPQARRRGRPPGSRTGG